MLIMTSKAVLLALITLLCGSMGAQSSSNSVNCNIEVTDAYGYEVTSSRFIMGLSYILTCSCQNINQAVNYKWRKNNSLLSGEVSSTLTLSQLKLSDAGRYTCNITNNVIHSGSSVDIIIQIPAPSYVIIRSDKHSPIRPVGSNVTLTCRVGLHSSAIHVQVPLNVNIQLTNPAGRVLNTTMDSVSGSTYTSQATISSFERAQSGIYTCEATLTSPSSHLSESSTLTEEINLRSGVYLSLGSTIGLQNNTCASTSDIGSSPPRQLACVTDKMPCCQTEGQWYFPNGSQIWHTLDRNPFYVERTNEGSVNLFRGSNVLEPYGEFCCRIADAADITHTLCINLIPPVSIWIDDNGSTPVAGLNYSLSCNVSGIDHSITTLTYEWRKDDTLLSEVGPILSFSPLRLSNAGKYSCSVSMYRCPFNRTTKTVVIQETRHPISVTLISDPVSPLGRTGSNVHVICRAELSQVVDIPVTVQIRVTDPNGVLLPAVIFSSTSSYTSRALITSFRNSHAGIYTCTVTLSSPVIRDSISTERVHIYAGVHLSFRGMTYRNNSIFFINEIGRTTSNNAIQCVTDKQWCCLTSPYRSGEWHFPNGTLLPREHHHVYGFATHFYRNRADNGTVSLNRVNSHIVSPTGRYCCELPDAAGVRQSLCAYIVDIKIMESFAPQIGLSDYTLTCVISGGENLSSRIAYQWFEHIGNTQTRIGTSTSVLSLPPLKLSSAGRYTCEVTLLEHPTNASNTAVRNSWDVIIPIPPLIELNITSDPPSPIRPIGTSVTLNCSCDIGRSLPAKYLDIGVTVTISLSDPSGTLLATTPPSVNGSMYTSSAVIGSFGRDQSGNYTCRASVRASSSFIIGTDSETSISKLITTGVYLSLGESRIPQDSTIFITDIGTTSPNQLMCTTDRKPCCQDQPQYGGWYFPNRSRVLHLSERPPPTAFHSDRNTRGAINLYRTSTDFKSPVGLFCCETIDATNANHTLCVTVASPITANITSKGVPRVGQNYTLICNILSGLDGLNAVINYQWTKDNGTRTQIGTNSNTLSFPSLRLSEAGSYTCEITVNSNHYLTRQTTVTTNTRFEILVPQPSISLVSNISNPILSGSSPTLLCIVELHPAVDGPVDLKIIWISPHGSTFTSNLVMKSFSLYTSKVVLSDVGLADAGMYTCLVNIGKDITTSVEKDIQIGEGMFQLRFMYTDDCRMWYKSSSGELYKYYIEEALIEAIKLRCECHFPRENLLQESFSCSSSPHLTTYRNTLIGTHNVNASQLVGFIQDWVNSGPKITIKSSYSVWVDKKCPVAVSSSDELECGGK